MIYTMHVKGRDLYIGLRESAITQELGLLVEKKISKIRVIDMDPQQAIDQRLVGMILQWAALHGKIPVEVA